MSNRSKFASIIADQLETSKKQGNELLEMFTESLQTHLKTEGQAVFPGFGRLKIQTRPARKGHNPKTGAPIDIPAKVVFKFKAFPGALK